jgi:hypothetical protein
MAPEVGVRNSEDGRTRLTLDLPQDGSVFVVFRDRGSELGDQGSGFRVSDLRPLTSVQLLGAWDVTFQAGRGAPAKARVRDADRLDGARRSGNQILLGHGEYRKRLTRRLNRRAAGRSCRWAGRGPGAGETHGKDLGIVWTAPWRID